MSFYSAKIQKKERHHPTQQHKNEPEKIYAVNIYET